jgi:hypothetical protein
LTNPQRLVSFSSIDMTQSSRNKINVSQLFYIRDKWKNND